MGYIEGTSRQQMSILSLDDMVGQEAMVRVIDRFIEVVGIEKLGFTKSRPAATGRPAYSPKALCKLYVYGYENGIRSSRRLERETHRNIEVMWLLDSLKPDHKTISEFRRENIQPLQKLFKEFVKLCKSWDLIGGELIAIDGSKFKADNNKKNNFSKKKIDDRLKRIEEQIQKFFDEMESADTAEAAEQIKNSPELADLSTRQDKYEEYKKHLEDSGENEVSTVDPDARLMGNNRGGVDVSYNVQSAVDGKHGVVIDFNVSTNPSDQHQLSVMARKVQKTLNIRKFTSLTDKGYYNGEDLLRTKRLGVTAIAAKQKPSNPKDMPDFLKSKNFVYNETTDTISCPTGHILSTTSEKTANKRRYHNRAACAACPYKKDCIRGGNAAYRTITRGQYSKIYDETDKRYKENKELYKRRQELVEAPFGTVKRTQNGGYFILRTKRKVQAEIALLFLGYNLKRALKIMGFDKIMARLNSLAHSFLSFPFLPKGKKCRLCVLIKTLL